jgi:hypothetical protein
MSSIRSTVNIFLTQVTNKHYAVWYIGGSGGYIVSWLLQLCIDPELLPIALDNFDLSIDTKNKQWKSFEDVPPNIGIVANAFYSKNTTNADIINSQTITLLTNIISSTENSFNKTLPARIKYFLTSYVWGKSSFNINEKTHLANSKQFKLINNPLILDQYTTPVFNADKSIFVIAPKEFTSISLESKTTHTLIDYNIENIIISFERHLKIFYTSNIWKDSYIENLERITNKQLTPRAIAACNVLVKRWLLVQPKLVKEYIISVS